MTDVTRQNVRGSTLLLSGRCVSLALNMAAQVMTVQYLSKLDYGLFAFSFILAELAMVPVLFGMDAALAKFVPVYHEQGDRRRILGSILLAAGSVLGFGLALVVLVLAFQGQLAGWLDADPRSLWIVLALVMLAPINALTCLVESLVAAFAGAWSILICRHLFGPSLKLILVTIMVLTQSGVLLLAVGHVVTGGLALLLYTLLLLGSLRKEGLLEFSKLQSLTIPAREFFTFGTSQVGADVVLMLRAFLPVILLQTYQGMPGIADYRAVLPVARLNDVVIVAFSLMFMQAFSRLVARRKSGQANQSYWRTTAWITVLTFPVFAFTFACAAPITELLFGQRYASSAQILAVLSCGLYFHAALGLNGQALWVLGKVRWIMLVEIITTTVAFVLYLYFTPRYGALGAAVAMSLTLVVYALLKQASLILASQEITFNWQHARLLFFVLLSGLALLAVKSIWTPPVHIGALLAVVGCLLLIAANRSLLDIENTFPELKRIPLARRCLGITDA